MPESVPIGVLYDFPQHDGGESFEAAVRQGFAATPGLAEDAIVLRPLQVLGLPSGSESNVVAGFRQLDESGVVAVIGPSISDNGVVARDLADAARLPSINYTGGERTRSEWMFHYQVGSLEEEPIVLAEEIRRRGLGSAGLLYDDSLVGRRYAECFESCGLVRVAASAPVSALAEDLTGPVGEVRAAAPEALCYLGLGVAARAVALAVQQLAWDIPVVANSALMFGYLKKDWRAGWEGWTYVDTVADDNPERDLLRERSPRSAAGPVGVAAYDIGRLVGHAVLRSEEASREGLRVALEGVKRLPAASGHGGTTMGFGAWDRGALKGDYLVLRTWRGGKTVQD